MKIESLQDLNKLKKNGEQQLFPSAIKISVGLATCGIAKGADAVYNAFRREVKKQKLKATVEPVGCSGWCSKEPIVNIIIPRKPKITFGEVLEADVPAIVRQLKLANIPESKILYRTDTEENIIENKIRKYASGKQPASIRNITSYHSLPLFKKQKRIALRNCGIINPTDIREYIARGGFIAACKALTGMKPENIIKEVQRSGLRGRGGAGFPTGDKWKMAGETKSKRKYIICNADEGDPGAYMDRSILEGDPYSVLEGMLIAARAIGASEGYIYVRGEYPLAVKKMTEAISQLKKEGLLGRNIFGTGFIFNVKVEKGAGAFVCGEETALIASIEGYAGEPVPRPPYPVEKGLWGFPTCINNVETLANVPVILSRGGAWFSGIGTGKSRGTKIFSLVGAVERVGLIEVPMGTPLKDIIYDIGGGVSGSGKLKAVQTGGPSGGCIPKELTDLSVDYESLTKAGSIMGSGGMIVMDDKTCMVDVAKYFMSFLKDESCGKCLPCREGTQAVFEILSRITGGKGRAKDIAYLKDVCDAMSKASLCALGKTAANPVLSTLRYFKKEYDEHINKKKCPAGVCTALINFSIDADKCIGCGACKKICPSDAVSGSPKEAHRISQKKCIKCRGCYDVCPVEAVIVR
jgi:NADH:ubiquinone oxidoreductase subunit F (NADH-binding)